MKFGDKGNDVRLMQEGLLARGYNLPRFGVDGDFGQETATALRQFAADNCIDWKSGYVSFRLLDLVLDQVPMVTVPPDPPITDFGLDVRFMDLRSEQLNPPVLARKFKRNRHGRVVRRDPSEITGITIHQTAVKYSVADYQIVKAGGDRELALARRALRVACHVMTFHNGLVVAANPLDWYIHHGNGFNRFELGIEIDGNYPGLIGGETWNKKQATKTTDLSISAARAGIEYLVREGRKAGMPITQIHAHRQSSATRRSDPGEELWRRVVLEYAVPVLGLETEPAKVLRNGRPIPKEWDDNGVGSY